MTLSARCPHCGTLFRVVQDQLRISEGWVRCGRCHNAFNAIDAMVPAPRPDAAEKPSAAVSPEAPTPTPSATPPARSVIDIDDASAFDLIVGDDAASEPWDALLDADPAALAASRDERDLFSEASADLLAESPPDRSLDRLLDRLHDLSLEPPADRSVDRSVDGSVDGSADRSADRSVDGFDDPPVADDFPPDDYAPAPFPTPFPAPANKRPRKAASSAKRRRRASVRAREKHKTAPHPPSFVVQAERAARWQRPGVRLALALVALLAAAGLAAQAIYVWRDRIAASDPRWRAALDRTCETLGCRVGEYRQIDALSVESSELVHAERAPFYRLSLTLRNRAAHDVAAPAIDLRLNDIQGRPIARRVLTMQALGVPALSLKAGGELPIQAALAVSGRPVSDYTVEIFYP